MEKGKGKSFYCRLCSKIYVDTNTSKEPRKGIFKRTKDGNSIQGRLRNFNVFLRISENKSDTICRSCDGKLLVLEKAEKIKSEWSVVNGDNSVGETFDKKDQDDEKVRCLLVKFHMNYK